MMKNLMTPLVIFLGIGLSTAAFAVEYQSPRTLALGGAGRGAPLLTDAIYLNPSYSSFVTSYSLAGSYLWFDQGRNYNLSVQDSRTELFQAGMGYTKREGSRAINIGASKNVVNRLGVGIGTKFVLDDVTNDTSSSMSISTSFIATEWMYASLIIDNLFESDSGKAKGLYRDFYLGFKFIPTREVQVYLDPVYSPSYPYGNKAGFSAGIELALMSDFYLRTGKFVDAEVAYLNTRGDGWGVGLGWLGPKVDFEFALHRVTSNHLGTGYHCAHTASMTIFF
jgi:hypothetical protein